MNKPVTLDADIVMAHAVRDAAITLNVAIKKAQEAGLTVKVAVREFEVVTIGKPLVHKDVQVEVSRFILSSNKVPGRRE